ncbi:MAG TPA: phage holin family protein [Burkholderiales bacterium]|nr:phage holin family protein [Burkholderiales bacterium]
MIGRLIGEARSLAADFAELAVLDARRAAIRLAWLLAAVLVAAVLIVTTWMELVAAGVILMLGQGASWVTALAVAAGLNIVGAGALAWWMFALIKEMPFTALLRQLRGDPPQKPQ